jgi:hypothetical protein
MNSTIASGNWTNPLIWSLGAVPTAANDVVISSGHLITFDAPATLTINSLTIQPNGRLTYDDLVERWLVVARDLNIAPNGAMSVAMGGGFNNRLVLRGNVVNNGQWLMRPVPNNANPRVFVRFSSTALQTITGTGFTRLNAVELDKGGVGNVVECQMDVDIGRPAAVVGTEFPIEFLIAPPFGGTWRQFAGTLRLSEPPATGIEQYIPDVGKIEIIGTASMRQNAASLRLTGGEIYIKTSGLVEFGTNAGNSLEYNTASTNRLTIEQGTVRIAGRISQVTAGSGVLNYMQTGGTLITAHIANPATTRSSFDLRAAASQFTFTGGSIILRNVGAGILGPGRPADFTIGASLINTGAGTVQFGDGSAIGTFDFNVPPNAVFNNISVFQGATAQPYATSTALRMAGDLTVNGTFNFTTPSVVAGSAAQTLIFQGANSVSQTVTSTPPFAGVISLNNLTMNRQGAGSGVANVNRGFSVAGVLDFQFGPASVPQILSLNSTLGITVTNTALQAVVNAGAGRYARTSATGGFFTRSIAGAGAYLLPIGSLGSTVNPADTYTPMTVDADAGASGIISVRVAPGQSTTRSGGHAQLDPQWQTYLRRVWTVGATTFIGTGRLNFTYPGDWAGSLDVGRVGRYTPNETTTLTAGGAWQVSTGSLGGYSATGGIFSSLQAQNGMALNGDWTIVEAANRLFYSRGSGLWRDGNTWSLLSHIGSSATLFPSRAQDSVIIGGGTDNLMNHVVTLDTNITVRGLALGTGTSNTGTLELQGESVVRGQFFMMTGFNTLRIGSTNGIVALPDTLTGNIRTTQVRFFSPDSRYEYIGSAQQRFGTGLPPTVRSLWVTKMPATSLPLATSLAIPTVNADTNVTIRGDLRVNSGALDLGTYTLNAQLQLAVATSLSLGAGAVVRFGGSRTFVDQVSGSLNGYTRYFIDSTSTVEWYGSVQSIPSSPDVAGYGNIIVRGMGTKIIRTAVLARGSVYLREAAVLSISREVGALRVWRDFYNDAILQNDGLLDIGR